MESREWTGNGELCDTIYFQGMNNSQVQARKYTGPRDMLATTGEIVGCQGKNGQPPLDVIYQLYIGKEIADVDLNPLESWYKPIKVGGVIASSLSNHSNNFTFTSPTNLNGESVAYHAPNRKNMSIGQKDDIESLKAKYQSWQEYQNKNKFVIYYGVSRGTAAIFNGLATNPELAANAKLAIFEGAVDSIPDVLHDRYTKKTGSETLADMTANIVNTGLSLYTPYKPDGIAPIDCVDSYPENLPSVFITSEIDEDVPCERTENLARALANRGKNDVYLLKLKHSSHPNYMFDNKEDHDIYETFIHAIYKKYGLLHNPELAKKGEMLVSQCKLEANTLADKINETNNKLESLAKELKGPYHNYTIKLAQDGVSGTYFILKQNQPIAVYKDADEDPLSPNNPKTIAQINQFFLPLAESVIQTFGYPTSCRDSVAGQGYANDIVSCNIANILSKKMGFDKITIPETILAEKIYVNNDRKEKGVLIDWVNQPISLESYTSFFKDLETLPEGISMEAFEQMVVVDYITGNDDRKPGNILTQKDKDMLFLIDNSWAFSPVQGEAISKNQYAWGNFSVLANQHFSKATRDKISNLFENRYQLAQLVYKKFLHLNAPGQTKELNFQRAMCFLHRIEMIHHLVCEKNATFKELSQMRFDYQFLKLHQKGDLQLASFLIPPKEIDMMDCYYEELSRTKAAKTYLANFGVNQYYYSLRQDQGKTLFSQNTSQDRVNRQNQSSTVSPQNFRRHY